ncbi:MAG TPA: 1-deoxy-D-xylulose-5-phosphate reductoisomerase [Treponema sp.]|nr:1-deoxy-D-xylulose-5-phosphate reductoisomerase [Treponema sp.]
MKKILVLGCTGSIGSQTLDIIRAMPDDFCVAGLAAGHDAEKVSLLAQEFGCPSTLFARDGIEGIRQLVRDCGADIAVNGIAGSAGLEPSVLVLEHGMDLALANKETVVMAWPIVRQIAARQHAQIIPVDSEHSAVFSLLRQAGRQTVKELVITASGGPFRTYSDEQLQHVTLEQALRHPTWSMGKKITVDSATLANKGLEVIEACRLFDFSPENIKVVVHPQSLIHSLVRTKDGMLYAQISNPDMRRPIFGALTYPEIKESYLEPFELAGQEMSFFAPRPESFPLLPLAYDCARKGNSYTIAFNAANEIAVGAFLAGKCTFPQIAQTVEATLRHDWSMKADTLAAVFEADKKARNEAASALVSLTGGQR